MKVKLVALSVILSVSAVAHADDFNVANYVITQANGEPVQRDLSYVLGAVTELQAITPNMSDSEKAEKVSRFLQRGSTTGADNAAILAHYGQSMPVYQHPSIGGYYVTGQGSKEVEAFEQSKLIHVSSSPVAQDTSDIERVTVPFPHITIANPNYDQAKAEVNAFRANPTKAGLSGLIDQVGNPTNEELSSDVGANLTASKKAIRRANKATIEAPTPATETVKGTAFAEPVEPASKLDTTPDKAPHVATQATITPIHNDSSEKRAHVVALKAAQSESTATATAYKMGVLETQSKAVAPAPVKAATAPVKQPTAVVLNSATVSTAGTKAAPVAPSVSPVAESFQDQATSAVNDLIDAHNENVAAIEDNSAHIASLEQSTNQRFADMGKQVNDNRKRAAAGVAGVAAIASIPQVTDSQLISFGAGVGSYDNQQSVAVGFSARVSDHIVTKAAVSAGTFGGAAVGAGMSWGW